MEAIRENIDFDKVLMTMTPEQIMEWEDKAKSYKQQSLDRRVVELENWRKQAKVEIKCLANENRELKDKNEKFETQLGVMQGDTDKVTKTLLTHGTEKRQLENFIHKLVYKEVPKGSIRDELFHGYLTKCCKGHINTSLGVSAFQWIELDDIETVKKLAIKFLNKISIHSLMRKESDRLDLQLKKSNKDNKKGISNGQARKFALLELLIEEIGGDINEI